MINVEGGLEVDAQEIKITNEGVFVDGQKVNLDSDIFFEFMVEVQATQETAE